MYRNRLALYVHFVWATRDRLPLITPKMKRHLYGNIVASAESFGCQSLAINGMADHVHALLSLPATVAVADVMKKMMETSSVFVNEQLQPPAEFKWQGFYGALSISRWDLPQVINYITAQKKHHDHDMLWPELENTFEALVE